MRSRGAGQRRRGRDAAGWPVAAGMLAGVAADALLRDPRRGHPVALFGRAAAAAEARGYAATKARGAAYTAACVAGAAAPAMIASWLARRWLPGRLATLAPLALTAAVSWTSVGAASLAAEARRLATALEAGDLEAARAVLPSLCGRDPAGLDGAGLARAAVESVAENTCDAAVAALLWGAAAGPAGLAAYRAVNTLDAMVGYRSDRYREFGWASARLDDVAGAVPARVTAVLAAVCAPIAGGRPGNAIRVSARDGARHPSPNAGRCEAAFAGALGVRLGGTNIYHGAAEHRPELGDGRAPQAADIRRAVRLSRAVTWAAAALAAVAALAADGKRVAPAGWWVAPAGKWVARGGKRVASGNRSVVPGRRSVAPGGRSLVNGASGPVNGARAPVNGARAPVDGARGPAPARRGPANGKTGLADGGRQRLADGGRQSPADGAGGGSGR